MARKSRKARLPRGSQKNNTTIDPNAINTRPSGIYYYDLDVPLVMSSTGIHASSSSTATKKKRLSMSSSSSKTMMWRGTTEQHRILIQRLRNTGYSVIAFSHTVQGNELLDPVRDGAMRTIPPSIVEDILYGSKKEMMKKKKTKTKRKRTDVADGDTTTNDDTTTTTTDTATSDAGAQHQNRLGITILRRLNVIIEQPSDLAHYSTTPTDTSSALSLKHKAALNSYDLIALTPLNDESLTSSCNSTTTLHSDIITLDYTKGRGGIQLPYKLRAADVRAATRRGIAFEIPYGPALVDPSKRRALVRTARLVKDVCLGVREPHSPRIVLSSGSRRKTGGGDKADDDVGVMALRSPGDMKNLAGVVLGWDDVLVSKITAEHPQMAVLRGHNRRSGRTVVKSEAGMGIGKTMSIAFSVSIVGKRGSGKEQLTVGPVVQPIGAISIASAILNKPSPASEKGRLSTEVDAKSFSIQGEEESDDDDRGNCNKVEDDLIRLP